MQSQALDTLLPNWVFSPIWESDSGRYSWLMSSNSAVLEEASRLLQNKPKTPHAASKVAHLAPPLAPAPRLSLSLPFPPAVLDFFCSSNIPSYCLLQAFWEYVPSF